jgi:hypothetical protein
MQISYASRAQVLRRHLDILPLRDRLDRLAPGLLDPSVSEAMLGDTRLASLGSLSVAMTR